MKINVLKCILPLLLIISIGLNAQNDSRLWTPTTNESLEGKQTEYRNTLPVNYTILTLNTEELTTILEKAPSRKLTNKSNIIMDLPDHNGNLSPFMVFEASILAPELQNKFPTIRSFAAQGIDDPTAIARFSYSQVGLHVSISSGNHSTIYIDPYTKDLKNYIVYKTNSLPANPHPFECLTDGYSEKLNESLPQNTVMNADDGKLRTFRLALACTAQYSQYHLNNQGVSSGATDAVKKQAVLSAMNVTMSRVNGVYERDMSLTMEIVANNENIIFLDTSTQPFNNNNAGTLINQSQTVCDNNIGSGNYDIGHTFSTGGGGLALLGSVCAFGHKAKGITGSPWPIGDAYNIDYVAHEMGHQFGANHTQNNNCQRNSQTAMEPGSASTIMGYAGICSPNVQNFSDDYFHAVSINEMWINITNGNSQCATLSDTQNQPPTADAGSNYTIPVSTPFILSGTGTDPDSQNSLTYTWEQMNPQTAFMPPLPSSTQGPAFRSIKPSVSSDRYMPALNTVLSGQTQSTWEVVPAVTRSMSFRFTVRDNSPGGSSTASDNIIISTNANAGPFKVTSQNTTSTTWEKNSTQTITWDVADTHISPINSPNVDILLSMDGGMSFPIVLASSTPNDGSQGIQVPNTTTQQARVMVRSSNNIFYQVNRFNIEIVDEMSTDEFNFEGFTLWPNPSSGTFNLSFIPHSSDNVQLKLYDLRGRLIDARKYDNSTGSFEQALEYSHLVDGFYLLTISNGNKMTTKKLIKN